MYRVQSLDSNRSQIVSTARVASVSPRLRASRRARASLAPPLDRTLRRLNARAFVTHSMTTTSTSFATRVSPRARVTDATRAPSVFSQNPAAARKRTVTPRARARSADARLDDALEYLTDLYADSDARGDGARARTREDEAMERLGLAEAAREGRKRSSTRDLGAKTSYGVTRVNFGAVVECEASAEAVYGWWTTPAALAETFPELTRCEATPDGRRARCEWAFAVDDVQKMRGRDSVDAVERHLSLVRVTENEPGSSATYEATAGMPVCGAVVVTSTGANSCTLDVDGWVHFPLSLTSQTGTMAVGMDAQNKFFNSLTKFKELCASGGVQSALDDVKARAEAATVPGDRVTFNFSA